MRSWSICLRPALDWLVIACLIGAFIGIDQIYPVRRPFNLTDPSIMYPFIEKERIPVSALFLLSTVFPAVIIFFLILLRHRKWKAIWWEVHFAFLSIALCITLAATITNLTKVVVGRPRPDFLARCVPSTSSSSTLVTVDVCTQKSLIEKGLRSFPAEHAAISFAGLGYLAFAVSRYFSFFAPQKNFTREGPTEYSNNSLVVFVIGVICPFILAGWCAWSKVLDNRHHPTDVIAGSLLGVSLAYTIYRLYNPPLALEWYNRPPPASENP